MSLVIGAITPHPPLLLASIGKEKTKQLAQTRQAFDELEGLVYSAKPDIIIVISPHAPLAADAFYINLSTHYDTDLKEFADISTKLTFTGDLELVSRFKQAARDADIPIKLTHHDALDYGTIIPLYFLMRHRADARVVPVSYSLLDYETHFEFGRALQREILNSNKRIAVVASGDLSHRLTDAVPAADSKALRDIDKKLISEGSECGLRAFIVLFGNFNSVNFSVSVLSYEHPFGVGYLVAKLSLE